MISHSNTEKIPLKRHADSRNAGRSDIINYVGEELFTIWILLTLGCSCSVLARFQQAGFVCESELSIDYSCQEKATPRLMPLPIGAL